MRTRPFHDTRTGPLGPKAVDNLRRVYEALGRLSNFRPGPGQRVLHDASGTFTSPEGGTATFEARLTGYFLESLTGQYHYAWSATYTDPDGQHHDLPFDGPKGQFDSVPAFETNNRVVDLTQGPVYVRMTPGSGDWLEFEYCCGSRPTTTTLVPTTTTTTGAPCSGLCTWAWSDGTKTWSKTSDTCSSGCACHYPSRCGSIGCEVTSTYCGVGTPPPACHCNYPTTTTTTSTTTTAGPTTTTTQDPACGDGCDFVYFPDHPEARNGWWLVHEGCVFPCQCPLPPGPGALCGTYHTLCTTLPPVTTLPPSCQGVCHWIWNHVDGAWITTKNTCNTLTVTGCDCSPPSVDGEQCATAVTPCRVDLSTSTTTPGPTTTSGPATTTTTTLCPTTTTGGPGQCGGICVWRGDGSGGWTVVSTNCGAGCNCGVAPWWESSSACETAETPCNTGTTTTTTSTTPCPYTCTYICNCFGTGCVWSVLVSDCTGVGDCICPPAPSGNVGCSNGELSHFQCSGTTSTTTSTTTTSTTPCPNNCAYLCVASPRTWQLTQDDCTGTGGCACPRYNPPSDSFCLPGTLLFLQCSNTTTTSTSTTSTTTTCSPGACDYICTDVDGMGTYTWQIFTHSCVNPCGCISSPLSVNGRPCDSSNVGFLEYDICSSGGSLCAGNCLWVGDGAGGWTFSGTDCTAGCDCDSPVGASSGVGDSQVTGCSPA